MPTWILVHVPSFRHNGFPSLDADLACLDTGTVNMSRSMSFGDADPEGFPVTTDMGAEENKGRPIAHLYGQFLR